MYWSVTVYAEGLFIRSNLKYITYKYLEYDLRPCSCCSKVNKLPCVIFSSHDCIPLRQMQNAFDAAATVTT